MEKPLTTSCQYGAVVSETLSTCWDRVWSRHPAYLGGLFTVYFLFLNTLVFKSNCMSGSPRSSLKQLTDMLLNRIALKLLLVAPLRGHLHSSGRFPHAQRGGAEGSSAGTRGLSSWLQTLLPLPPGFFLNLKFYKSFSLGNSLP